jgi:23S rRNA (guanine2445-N2)-methyltransferase / 23S rRNA (guanine2069-N7)-methyltransferase
LHYLYESLGNIINESYPAWRTTLITDNEKLGKYTGLTLFDQFPFDNGPIACQVMCYRAPRPVSKSRQQRVEQEPASQQVNEAQSNTEVYELSEHAQSFANRFKKNLKHLAKWARKNDVQCYRVYDADLPDYAVAVDLYGDYAHVQEYAPPKSINPEKAVQRIHDVMHVLPEILSIPASNVVLKLRQKQKGTQQYEAHASQKHRFTVKESGLNFSVNLTDYLDTGLFLDHRITRQMLMAESSNVDFLNLFAYTGSGSVYAAAGRAKSTTTVDMSNTYLEWAKDNMALNGFTGPNHHYIRANCLEWLQAAQQDGQRYGVIFLDPPTFSNSSRMEGVFDIQRDHVSLIEMTTNLLTDDGLLFFSTNRRDFKLDTQLEQNLSTVDISKATLPQDFERNPKIHYCWKISKLG